MWQFHLLLNSPSPIHPSFPAPTTPPLWTHFHWKKCTTPSRKVKSEKERSELRVHGVRLSISECCPLSFWSERKPSSLTVFRSPESRTSFTQSLAGIKPAKVRGIWQILNVTVCTHTQIKLVLQREVLLLSRLACREYPHVFSAIAQLTYNDEEIICVPLYWRNCIDQRQHVYTHVAVSSIFLEKLICHCVPRSTEKIDRLYKNGALFQSKLKLTAGVNKLTGTNLVCVITSTSSVL